MLSQNRIKKLLSGAAVDYSLSLASPLKADRQWSKWWALDSKHKNAQNYRILRIMASSGTGAMNDISRSGFDDFESRSGGIADQIDLQHYLRILRKHKWLMLFFSALVTCLAAYYAHTATPIYRSTATLLIESQNDGPIPFDDLLGTDVTNSEYFQTQFELLKSRELAKRVISALNLTEHPELSPWVKVEMNDSLGSTETGVQGFVANLHKKVKGFVTNLSGDSSDLSSTESSGDRNENITVSEQPGNDLVLSAQEIERTIVSEFQSRLAITPVRKTNLVKISFESADPEFAATVANTVGEQYILANLDARMADTLQVSTWMDGQIDSLKAKLEDSERRLLEYRLANGLVDAGSGVTGVQGQQIMLLTQELLRAENDLASAASVRNEARSMGGNINLLETLPAVQQDSIVRDVKLQLGQQQRDLDELGTRYGNRHPKIRDANSKIASLQLSLEQNVRRIVGTLENEYQLASQRVASLRGSIGTAENKIQATGGKTFDLEKLQREVDTNQKVYDEFRTRRTEAQSTEGLESPNARVSDPAVAEQAPVKPKKSLIIALAALGSLLLSALMAFLYEQMDDTVKSAEDVEKKIGARMLGILPLLKGGIFATKKSLPINPLDIKDKKGTFTESINTARTAICLDDGGRHRRVILVTSSVPGEGKSTTSLNLAYALAQMEKTLLIDCDLRRPTIAKAINLPKEHNGLSSMIAGTVPARDCIQRGAVGELDVICSGPSPDQPLELLSSARFTKIIEQLSTHYDRIVLDCAPTQAVSDALVLSQLSDAVVYNVKSHDTSIELVKRGLQRLKQVNAPIAGVLITQVDIEKIVSYGGDYYYQGYYDYYGYNAKGEKGSKLKLSAEEIAQIRSEDSDIQYDFGLNGARSAIKTVNGASANGTSVPGDEFQHEFDATTQFDANGHGARANGHTNGIPVSQGEIGRPVSRESNTIPGGNSRDKFVDDLDLV